MESFEKLFLLVPVFLGQAETRSTLILLVTGRLPVATLPSGKVAVNAGDTDGGSYAIPTTATCESYAEEGGRMTRRALIERDQDRRL